MAQPIVWVRVGDEVKAQQVRLLDVFLIGPLMVWGGASLHKHGHGVAGLLLWGSGLATITYNGRNYVRIKERLRRA